MNNASKYNPQIHHRRSIRLKGYDYSQAGSYFITICCEKRKCRFGKIICQEMVLNQYGVIAHTAWQKLGERFANCVIDVFTIMPNHMHGIIRLRNTVGSGFTPGPNNVLVLNDRHNRAGVNPARTELDIANGELQNINDRHNRAGVNPARTELDMANGELQNLNDRHNRAGVNPARTDLDILNGELQNINDKHNGAGVNPARAELDIANSELQNLNDKHNRAGVNPARAELDMANGELQNLSDKHNGSGVNPARTNGDLQNLNDRHNRAGVNPAATASVSDIVGAYKSITSNLCLDIYKSRNERMGKLWQRDYYEHIIRDERAYRNISAYIRNNPSKWGRDRFGK